MFQAEPLAGTDKPAVYADLCRQAEALLADERDLIANAANFAALIFHSLPDINWAGFYFFDGRELVVGPFQGQPACIRIALGKGVCGLAAETRRSQVVADVNAHPNHIFCDSASRSEVVVPLVHGDGSLLGVWDVDAPHTGRFDAEDQAGMEALCAVFMRAADPGE
jgi:GAF domain-containing protein